MKFFVRIPKYLLDLGRERIVFFEDFIGEVVAIRFDVRVIQEILQGRFEPPESPSFQS